MFATLSPVKTHARQVSRGRKRILRVTVEGAHSVPEARTEACIAAAEWEAFDADLDCFKGAHRFAVPLAGEGMAPVGRESLTYIFEYREVTGRADGRMSRRYRR